MRLIKALAVVAFACTAHAAHAQAIDWKKVDEAIGRPAQVSADVHRYGFPRSDLAVTLDGVAVKPALALGGWAAFKPAKDGVMVMGDLVLLESEIDPVMNELIGDGFDITAVHNHILRASPATFYMHVAGHGDAVRLADALKRALAASKTPLAAPGPAAPTASDLNVAGLEQIIGVKGNAAGGVYQFAIARREAVSMAGVSLTPPGPLGVATAINFQPTGDGKAAITGDFVLTENEVNPVLRALRQGNIEVTALHSHMLDEQPRLFFMHFWANDDAVRLARVLRTALGKMATAENGGGGVHPASHEETPGRGR